MASTELATTTKEELVQIAPAEEQVESNGNWGEDEPSRPEYLALKQRTTEGADEIPNGHFYHKGSGQHWASIKMVVLDMHKGRSWKPSAPAFVKGEKVLCRSINRTQFGGTPITTNFNLEPQSKDCSKCPKNSWAGYDKVSKLGPKPSCQKDFYFLFLESETNLPYIYTTQGKGVDPSDAVYDAVRSRAKIVKAKTGKMPSTWEFELEMTSELDGKYYKPKFTTVRQLKSEDAAKYGPLFEQFVQSRQTQAAPEATETTEAEYVEDTGAIDEVVEI